MRELEPGTEIAGYRIERIVGQGGMGLVYLATHLELGRRVALKLIAPVYAHDEVFRERFKEESRQAASIDHPNVIPVYEAREADGALFLAMRYVDGPDLRRLVEDEGPLGPERAAGIVAQVGSALDAAHKEGLVHRDVKPGNVLLTAGDPEHAYLTDFGLVKRIEATAQLTQSGQFVGTLDYMAPEQIYAEQPDARTDVYSLGCVLFHTLTGRVPFEREPEAAKIYAHLNEPPPRPSDVIGDLPGELDAVVTRAMAKEPAERFPSAGDLGRATRAAAQHRAPSQPERSVATGAAAPTRPASTRVAEPEATTTLVPEAPARRAPRARLAIVLAALAIAVLAFVLVIAPDGDDSNSGGLSPDAYFPAPSRVNWLDGFRGELLVTLEENGMEQLARLDDRGVEQLPVPPVVDFAGADLGSGRAEDVLAVYSRCEQEAHCDVFRSVLGKRAGIAVEGADLPDCNEVGPSVASGAIAYGVYGPGGPSCAPGLYLKGSSIEEPQLVNPNWHGGTELNEHLLAWVDGTRIRVASTDTRPLQPITVVPPRGHKFTFPVAIERGLLYFVDYQLAKGHSAERFFIARTDARTHSGIDRYGSRRAVAFTGKPRFAIRTRPRSLYFSGETQQDPKSGLETITRDDKPEFTHWLSP
jgi:hypothetical protein